MGRRWSDPGPSDDVIEVGDGRRLGYATFGDPDGAPVLNCHGGLVSRTDVAPSDAVARELGLRIISPDRPGIGLTDRLPGHGIGDWARTDVAALVDHLGLDRFSVMGWSAGGPHALAVADGAWGLRPEDVTVPVAIHHGTADRLVPVAWADELGRRIPDATVTTHPGGGHLIAVTHAREILGDLLAP